MADDLFNSFSSVRAFIRSELSYEGSSSGPKSDTLLNTYIRTAIVVVNYTIDAKTTRQVKALARSTQEYGLDSTVNILSAQIKITGTDSIKTLVYAPRELWSEQKHVSTEPGKNKGLLAVPSFFDYTDSSIALFPTPSKTGAPDSLILLVVQRQPDIDTLSSLTLFPRKYRVAIVMYATYMVARAIQHPYTPLFRSDYAEHISTVRSTLNRKQSGVANAPTQ